MIDAKMDEQSVDEIMTEIGKVTDKPVKYLINTHADGDHVMGNRFFPTSVTIISHENCRKEFFHPGRDGSPSSWNDPQWSAGIPAITFKESMALHLGSKVVELYYFGIGHTTGDTFVYFPEEKTVFIGDGYFTGRAQLIHSYKGGNSLEFVKTMDHMLAAIPANRFCSGHSEMAGREEIVTHINRIREKQAKVKGMLTANRSLDAIKGEFEESESALIETMYNELSTSF